MIQFLSRVGPVLGGLGVLLLVLATGSPAADPGVVGHAGGGGVAIFSDPANPFFGATTTFGIGVTFRADDTATGNFECVAGNLLSIHVDVMFGHVNSDGTAVFAGPGIVHFEGGSGMPSATFEDFFTIEVSPGGPGSGYFTFFGPVWNTMPPRGPDLETVVHGRINVN
jgi:hypothetical protein